MVAQSVLSLISRRPLFASSPEFLCLNIACRQMSCSSSTQSSNIFPALRLMPLGGSVTYGVGSSDGNGYRKALLDMLHSNGYDAHMVGSRKSGLMRNNDNEGWRGYRLDQIEARARSSVPTLRPNIFTINAGSNDCIQDFQLDDFGKRMSNLIEHLWETCPRSTVILSTLLINQDDEVNSRVLYINEQIRRLVESQIAGNKMMVLADMYSPGGPQVSDLVDGVHPNDAGYNKMASIWLSGIQEARIKGFL